MVGTIVSAGPWYCSKGNSSGFLWVHLLLNGLMILPSEDCWKKNRLCISLDRFCDGDSPLFPIVFHLCNPGKTPGNRDLCCRIRLCDRASPAPASMWKEFSLTVKWFYLFLIFLSGLMLYHNHRMDLNAIGIFQGLWKAIYWSLSK